MKSVQMEIDCNQTLLVSPERLVPDLSNQEESVLMMILKQMFVE